MPRRKAPELSPEVVAVPDVTPGEVGGVPHLTPVGVPGGGVPYGADAARLITPEEFEAAAGGTLTTSPPGGATVKELVNLLAEWLAAPRVRTEEGMATLPSDRLVADTERAVRSWRNSLPRHFTK